ncbi:hypothetical protein ACLOJK_001079 [Asimina triloba]
MGAAEREKGVVKLVHAGGFVEVHRKPIYAHQVMKKNPRHCVTRPDFFEYPWIVVRPDSLLQLGSVFYIVPNHTVYNLLQSHCRPQQNAAPKPCLRHGQEEKRPQIDGFERAGGKEAGGGNNAAPKPCLRHGDGQVEKMFQVIRKVRFRLPEGAAEAKINFCEEKVKMWLLDQRS